MSERERGTAGTVKLWPAQQELHKGQRIGQGQSEGTALGSRFISVSIAVSGLPGPKVPGPMPNALLPSSIARH